MKTRIKTLGAGEKIDLDGLTVKKKRRGCYVAFVDRWGHHRRGNLAQIVEDAEHYRLTGTLPLERESWA